MSSLALINTRHILTPMKSITLAITGASGVIYGQRLLEHLVGSDEVSSVNLVLSSSGKRVLAEELGCEIRAEDATAVSALLGRPQEKVRVFPVRDIGAKLASGSYPVDGMAIVPCSMGTLASIANGVTRDLVHRAADVILKEHRTLVVVPRETPFNEIHLENMLKLARMGVRVLPAMPSFYHQPKSIDDLIDHIVYRVMDQFQIAHSTRTVWQGGRA